MSHSRLTKTQTFTKGAPWLVYTFYKLITTLVTLPGYLARFLVSWSRPNAKWTFKQAFTNHMTRVVFEYVGVTELKTPQVKSSKLGDYVQLQPAEKQYYHGLLDDADVQPVSVGTIWVPSAPKDELKPGQFITLHLHGGAYVTLSPGMANVQSGPRLLAKELGTPVLMLDYRLSCQPKSWFPAALQDSITAYRYLLAEGYTKDQILLSGDSAGGNLVLALLRHITETGAQDLPAPWGAALWSPWTDMAISSEWIDTNNKNDFLTSPLVAWGVREYVPKGRSPDEAYFSPKKHPFKTGTRLFIHGGTTELLYQQISDAVAAFKDIEGNEVEFVVTENAVHDIFAGGSDMGFGQAQTDIMVAAHNYFAN